MNVVTADPAAFPPAALTVLDVIRARRTVDIGLLRPDPVPREVTEAILEAGIWAPNHGRTEPWRFTVFTGEGRARLAEVFVQAYAAGSAPDRESEAALEAQRARAWRAPLWISLELHMPEKPKMPEWEEQAALACAAQNMWLAATAFGLVGKWVSGPVMVSPVAAQALGAPKLLGLLVLGYPAAERHAATRAPLADKVTWVE